MDPYKIINQYYTKDSDLYNLLILHSECVRDKALAIVQKHPELNADAEFIAEAAMLHDIAIFMCDAPEIHCHGTHHYIQHGYLGSDLLMSHNLPRHALVCERHTGTGLSVADIQQQNLPLPLRDMLPISIEEQIICYADIFFSKSKPEKIAKAEKIKPRLLRRGLEHLERFELWEKMFE